jgi:hypothetical protein
MGGGVSRKPKRMKPFGDLGVADYNIKIDVREVI